MARTEALTQQPDAAAKAGEFASVLFETAEGDGLTPEQPGFFGDLNLDQVVAAVTAGAEEYELIPFFHTPLRSVAAVQYRHEVFRDLAQEPARAAVRMFAGEMQRVRRYLKLVEKLRYAHETERWLLDAVSAYCSAVSAFSAALAACELGSHALLGLRDYLVRYTGSRQFRTLVEESRAVQETLARVRYSVRIKGLRVTVSPYDEEADYSAEVERDFERFRQGDVDAHRFEIRDPGSMDHVEAQVAERVARLFPEAFRELSGFCRRRGDFLDATVVRFDREVQFYLAYLHFCERVRAAGLPFCYPTVSTESKETFAENAFDLALASKLAAESGAVVTNGFTLSGPERILVVTGPNQGGKTTFARMFGQLHYLASLGLPVPAQEARLFLPDRLFAHFEREEDITTLRGKLDDELTRLREIFQEATGDSVIVLNEVFNSTTLHDALYLGTEILRRVIALGSLAVCVTFVDELSSLGEETVSMVATVAPEDPTRRTYEIVRRPADGRAYALAIAERYGLGYETLKRRISG